MNVPKMLFRIAAAICITAFACVLAVVANPACIENDPAVAAQIYDGCLRNHTWGAGRCRVSAVEVSCKRWGYWPSASR